MSNHLLKYKSVEIRLVTRHEELFYIYHLIYRDNIQFLWDLYGDEYSFDEWQKDILSAIKDSNRTNLIMFIVMYNDSYCGYIGTSNMDRINGHCTCEIIIDPTVRYGGVAGIVYALFGSYLFHEYPKLRKLYVHVLEYNKKSITFAEKIGFTLEGTRRKHKLYQGNYWDLLDYSIFRNDYFINLSNRLPKLYKAIKESINGSVN